MRLSRERLNREATTTGFRVEILEKVTLLLNLLDGFERHPYLKGRLALKGGTALNLFVFDVPRLSIDIDLNYVGQLARDAMLAERPEVERAVGAVCGRAGITIDRAPGAHAGGKWRLRYESADGQSASLELVACRPAQGRQVVARRDGMVRRCMIRSPSTRARDSNGADRTSPDRSPVRPRTPSARRRR